MYARIKQALQEKLSQGKLQLNPHGIPIIPPVVSAHPPKPATWAGSGGFINEQNWRPSGGFVDAAAQERKALLPHLGNTVANALATPTANANAGRRAALRYYGV